LVQPINIGCWLNFLREMGFAMTDMLLIRWLLAFSPIAVVLIMMIGFKWSGGRAGAAGWFTALVVSVLFFGANPRLLAFAQLKGVLLSLYVLYIVWMALALYNVVNETGAIETIGMGIRRLTENKPLQLLILGWVFSSFLQGVAGFGVPTAVVGPLLMGLGFPAHLAVVAPSIGHCWSVNFGTLGSSFQALIAVTGLDGFFLAPWSGFFLAAATFLCGLGVAHCYNGMASLKQMLMAVLVIGTVMAGTQYVLAVAGLWTLAGFVAGMAGMAACLLVSRLARFRPSPAQLAAQKIANGPPKMSLGLAVSAYVILIVVVCTAELMGPVHKFLNFLSLSFYFPEIISDLGRVVPAGYGKKISVFGHAGALLVYTSLISYAVYAVKGCYRPGAVKSIIAQTVKSGVPTSIGIVSMVCFALIMDQCGMTYLLAEGISRVFGKAYPLFTPAVGALGAFMTGSNTNSNVVFGMLQKQTAELASLSVAVILGAQTAGGSLGSMFAPAKILVGCSTVGLSGKEGPVLATTLKYGLVITGLLGVIAFLVVLAGAR